MSKKMRNIFSVQGGVKTDLFNLDVALAVTRDGLPVRNWVFPGNTTDVTTVQQIRYVLRYNPKEARRQKAHRDEIVKLTECHGSNHILLN